MPEVAPTRSPRANGQTRVASQSRSTSTSSSAKTTISPVALSSPLLRAFESPGSGSRRTRTVTSPPNSALGEAHGRVGLRARCRPRSPRSARLGSRQPRIERKVARTESGRSRVQITTETVGARRRNSSRAATQGGRLGPGMPSASSSHRGKPVVRQMLSHLLGQLGLDPRRQRIRWEARRAAGRPGPGRAASRGGGRGTSDEAKGGPPSAGPRMGGPGSGLADLDLVHSHRHEVGRRRLGRAALNDLHAFNALRSSARSRLASANPAALEITPITIARARRPPLGSPSNSCAEAPDDATRQHDAEMTAFRAEPIP